MLISFPSFCFSSSLYIYFPQCPFPPLDIDSNQWNDIKPNFYFILSTLCLFFCLSLSHSVYFSVSLFFSFCLFFCLSLSLFTCFLLPPFIFCCLVYSIHLHNFLLHLVVCLFKFILSMYIYYSIIFLLFVSSLTYSGYLFIHPSISQDIPFSQSVQISLSRSIYIFLCAFWECSKFVSHVCSYCLQLQFFKYSF